MSLTYVIPDLHGRRDLLDGALMRIEDHAARRLVTIVMLGDYVEKGPDSSGVIARLRVGVGVGVGETWQFMALKGNHDAMMVRALRDPATMAF
jgi:serine/threonine protein phosphatase 1